MKLKLEVSHPHHWQAPGHTETGLTWAVPFFKSHRGAYVHRIRAGKQYWRDGEYTHTALKLWCGMTGLLSDKHKGSRMLAEPPIDAIYCATCEGRATGAGQLETHQINGRFVKFNPKP